MTPEGGIPALRSWTKSNRSIACTQWLLGCLTHGIGHLRRFAAQE